MNNIQTIGGVFTEEMRKIVYENIIRVFACNEDDIEELIPVQAGMTNIVLSFKLKGGKYCQRNRPSRWYRLRQNCHRSLNPPR